MAIVEKVDEGYFVVETDDSTEDPEIVAEFDRQRASVKQLTDDQIRAAFRPPLRMRAKTRSRVSEILARVSR